MMRQALLFYYLSFASLPRQQLKLHCSSNKLLQYSKTILVMSKRRQSDRVKVQALNTEKDEPEDVKKKKKRFDAADADGVQLPASIDVYKKRLQQQDKEMYKDPPVLPPLSIDVYCAITDTEPDRSAATDTVTFSEVSKQQIRDAIERKKKEDGSDDDEDDIDELYESMKNAVLEFQPNLTPNEILRQGGFGGTYFRTITSAVTNIKYTGTDVVRHSLHPSWYSSSKTKKNINIKSDYITQYLTSPVYQAKKINKYGVKCGGSLGMWESSGWITSLDPYGWFQWYCHFYRGRRTSDDVRQISRWKGVGGATTGRFKSQLCNKILKQQDNDTTNDEATARRIALNDISISPVIRQTLHHWGVCITETILSQHEEFLRQKNSAAKKPTAKKKAAAGKKKTKKR